MTDTKRWRGLRALIGDAVEHGASAIERVHLETARRPFAVLEQIPGIAEPAQVIHGVHDAAVASVYASIRGVNRVVGAALDAALEHAERAAGEPADAPDAPADHDS